MFFLRASNLLDSGPEIGFLAFCCLPYVNPTVDKVYIDTPSLFTLVSRMNDLRRIFNKDPLYVQNFQSYFGFHAIDPLSSQTSLVLISASCSGKLANRIVEECDVCSEKVVHLLFLGENCDKGKAICDLGFHASKNPDGLREHASLHTSGSCPMCDSGSTAVSLNGDQFDFAGPKPESFLIQKNDAPRFLPDTFERMVGAGVFASGAANGTSASSRDLYVDADALLACSGFQSRLEYILKVAIPASSSVILSLDKDSSALCEKVKSHLEACGGRASIVTDIQETGSSVEGTIVVVAAVIESGRGLTDVSRDLRSLAPGSPQVYLVGFEKTSGSRRREALRNTLTQSARLVPHTLVSVERLVLPPSADHNAWNEELELLEDQTTQEVMSTKSAGDRELVESRIKRLRNASKRMKLDLFLNDASGAPLRIQRGFVFWPDTVHWTESTQADVYFTIASVLQQLRANSEMAGTNRMIRDDWFHKTALSPSNFVRFNDDITQASLLRAAKKSELNYTEMPAESEEMSRIICSAIDASDRERGGAANEFMLAVATERLRLVPNDRNRVLDAARDKGGFLGVLRSVSAARSSSL